MPLNPKKTILYPLIGVDVALFCIEGQGLKALLVQRSQEPHSAQWALPGGLLKPDLDASLEDAAKRILRNKIVVDVPHLKEVCTFSGPNRDPRGWSISVLFYALLPRDQINALINNKVEAVKWDDAAEPTQPLAFDHQQQLQTALQILREKVELHNLPLHLMPTLFTLTQLQQTCEAILGRALDKSVFRRRLKQEAHSRSLIDTNQKETGLQRPATLYRARPGFDF